MRFTMTVEEIATLLQAEIIGDSRRVLHTINKIESAQGHELTFLNDNKFEKYLQTSQAGCVIIKPGTVLPPDTQCSFLVHAEPHKALVAFILYLQQSAVQQTGYKHNTAVIDKSARIAESAKIDTNVVIGAGCTIAEHVHVHAGVVLQNGVSIGSNTIVYPNVTIYADCEIGENCIIHAGAVIGSDGFGYLENPDKSFDKIPQIGNVIVGNNVEIGANSTIDRAALGSTIIRNGVKIDNLVHLAHNVEIGANTAIAAQTGIAGGTIIGDNNRIAGQVGIVGYVKTVENVIIGAQSGVSKNITKSGVYSGSPAVELSARLKQEVLFRKLPQMIDDLQKKTSETK
ncbi:MAG: UDP-3-O-(3-hydroxymyristoyl)glucosamine N-acyltransferase [Candidatus Kapaibacterium sp.]|nr:UDP-3-O-(3-hydroxymyristoyl)glucosamine N-acyltransferase [Bacteroidota bacterium]